MYIRKLLKIKNELEAKRMLHVDTRVHIHIDYQ